MNEIERQFMNTAEKCDSKDVALKSFFLGPQAENGTWVTNIIQFIFSRWISWRQIQFPEDGRAISESDQNNSEFLDRQIKFKNGVSSLVHRYENEVPKFSPRYIGHMFSEISLPSLFGHIVTLLHNPNNISKESSRVGVEIEDEAIQELRTMVGFIDSSPTGHFTSGGTVANFEALLRARERMALWIAAGAYSKSRGEDVGSLFDCAHMGWEKYEELIQKLASQNSNWSCELKKWMWTEGNPWQIADQLQKVFGKPFIGPVVLVPENKHYSWQKGVNLLGLGSESFWPIELDENGQLSIESLRERMHQAKQQDRPVAMVVSVAGSTELGEIDPIDRVNECLSEFKKMGVHIWHHVDAAYGGYYCSFLRSGGGEGLVNELGDEEIFDEPFDKNVVSALEAIAHSDSVTLDPHKLGYVPYSSGAFLCSSKRNYFVKSVQAPYLQYDSQRDRGPYTIEGSRSAAGAAATWMGAKCIGLHRDGYGRILVRGIKIRKKLENELLWANLNIRIAPNSNTNILCFTVAKPGDTIAAANSKVAALYEAFAPGGEGPFFVSRTTLSWKSYGAYLKAFLNDWGSDSEDSRENEDVGLIRLVLMNPFFNSKEMKTNFEEQLISNIERVLRSI